MSHVFDVWLEARAASAVVLVAANSEEEARAEAIRRVGEGNVCWEGTTPHPEEVEIVEVEDLGEDESA